MFLGPMFIMYKSFPFFFCILRSICCNDRGWVYADFTHIQPFFWARKNTRAKAFYLFNCQNRDCIPMHTHFIGFRSTFFAFPPQKWLTYAHEYYRRVRQPGPFATQPTNYTTTNTGQQQNRRCHCIAWSPFCFCSLTFLNCLVPIYWKPTFASGMFPYTDQTSTTTQNTITYSLFLSNLKYLRWRKHQHKID
jgi:hypothetical protein